MGILWKYEVYVIFIFFYFVDKINNFKLKFRQIKIPTSNYLDNLVMRCFTNYWDILYQCIKCVCLYVSIR